MLLHWLRHDVLALAGPALATRRELFDVSVAELADVARALGVPEPLVHAALMLHRPPTISPAYWQGWKRLRAQTGGKFHALFAAVSRAMADTPRSSSLVANLNSRLRSSFTLRRPLGAPTSTCCASS